MPYWKECGTPRSMLTHTWMMPLKVAATSVKLEMPPPTMSARPRPSAPAVATSSIVFAYAYVSCSSGNNRLTRCLLDDCKSMPYGCKVFCAYVARTSFSKRGWPLVGATIGA